MHVPSTLPDFPKRPLLEKAADVAGIPKAFRPDPLRAEEMDEFYSESLNKRRKNLRRDVEVSLLESAEQGFFFQGVIYGNRGTGKSTEINRLLDDKKIKDRFIVIRLDALEELNPQTFSVADVLLLIMANLIEQCADKCRDLEKPFFEAETMINDLQQQIAPFFPYLQASEQITSNTDGTASLSFLALLKTELRIGQQRKTETVATRMSLRRLSEVLERQIGIVRTHLPEYELLLVGENFDKETVPQSLLHDTFVQYSSVLRSLRLHMLFTLPVPFVYSYGDQLAFRRENRYPVYDIPVFGGDHKTDPEGRKALIELLEKRADLKVIFADDAIELLLCASGGDLSLLFAVAVRAGRRARYRHEDEQESENKVLLIDIDNAVREQLGIFRAEMGTISNDQDDTTWEEKRGKLRAIYERIPGSDVPDKILYQLLRRRAVLFFNGKGRYGVHPLAVEMMREQLAEDVTFKYLGGGLDLGS